MGRKRSQYRKKPEFNGAITALDQEGRGITHREGKVVFVERALPGEQVRYQVDKKKSSYEVAHALETDASSPLRVRPKCQHFGVCGGCSMQHIDAAAQVAVKQRVLEDNLLHIGRVRPEVMLPPIYGVSWHYRERARISVRYVAKKQRVVVGFHEKHSRFVTDMQSCEVLSRSVAEMLPPLTGLMNALSIREQLPQIEIAVGAEVLVLVLRVMAPLTEADQQRLRDFADEYQVQFWLQPAGPDSVEPFYPLDASALTYQLPHFDLVMPFAPTEFTQVNSRMNQVMVRQAIELLDPQPGERIADFFCGLGNFSLPLARQGARVFGVEGSQALVTRAQHNAHLNGLQHRCEFAVMNLFEITAQDYAAWGCFDKVLIDPPRDGADALVRVLQGESAPRRIVYVSCKPSTLARDAAVLVEQGYHLKSAGVLNMFPHTAHTESMAVFEYQG